MLICQSQVKGKWGLLTMLVKQFSSPKIWNLSCVVWLKSPHLGCFCQWTLMALERVIFGLYAISCQKRLSDTVRKWKYSKYRYHLQWYWFFLDGSFLGGYKVCFVADVPTAIDYRQYTDYGYLNKWIPLAYPTCYIRKKICWCYCQVKCLSPWIILLTALSARL